jgi:hypothetical protein
MQEKLETYSIDRLFHTPLTENTVQYILISIFGKEEKII